MKKDLTVRILYYLNPIKNAQPMAVRFLLAEVTGFEPAASWSQTKRDTKLRHASIFVFDINSSCSITENSAKKKAHRLYNNLRSSVNRKPGVFSLAALTYLWLALKINRCSGVKNRRSSARSGHAISYHMLRRIFGVLRGHRQSRGGQHSTLLNGG